jgi:hypothetical protein
MSNVVQFLETIARNPKQISAEEYVAIVIAAGLDSAMERALLTNDVTALNHGLGGRSAVACLIFPAEDEPNDGEEKEGDGDEAPEQESAALAA